MSIAVPTALAATLVGSVLTLAAPVTAAGADTVSSAAHTQRVVVRPVTAHGRAAHGWTVTRERDVTATCDGSSPAAVSRDIVECFPTAAYLPACWKSAHHTVLCLRDARTRTLVRVSYRGSVPQVSAPKRPSPLDLRLARHQGCSLRVGGAWGTLPTRPAWVGFYSCARGSVYGRPSGDGIDRARTPWTVHVWVSGTAHRVVLRRVRTAFYVGTRH